MSGHALSHWAFCAFHKSKSMRKKDIFQINAKDIIGTNHIYVGDTAGVISILKDFDPSPGIERDVRIEVYTHGYRSWALHALAFLFERGLVVEKRLMTRGQYIPSDLGYRGRRVVLDNTKFDPKAFTKLANHLISLDSSRRKKDRIEKVRLTNILRVYNDALLLNLNRTELYGQSDESYLNLLRLLDGLVVGGNAWDFSDKVVSKIGNDYVKGHYSKMRRLKLYAQHHIPIAEKLFTTDESYIAKKIDITKYKKSKADRVFLITLYALYQFRNKWIHNGFPLPQKETLRNNEKTKYFGMSIGASLPTKDLLRGSVSATGLNYMRYEDLIVEIAPPPAGMSVSADYAKLYILWPTWFFLNDIVRELIKKELKIN